MDSFGDHFSSLLGNGAIWTIISNSNHKCRLCNSNFRLSIACNVGLSYNLKSGYDGTKSIKLQSNYSHYILQKSLCFLRKQKQSY